MQIDVSLRDSQLTPILLGMATPLQSPRGAKENSYSCGSQLFLGDSDKTQTLLEPIAPQERGGTGFDHGEHSLPFSYLKTNQHAC